MKKRRRWLYWLLGVLSLIVLGGLGVGGYIAYNYFDLGRTAARAEEAAAAYRAAGMPWEADDLRVGPPLSAQENAAPLLQAIIEKHKPMELAKRKNKISQLLFEGKFDQVERELEPFNLALDAAVGASKKRGIDYKRDWDLGPSLLMPEYAHEKALVLGLCFRAQFVAARGDGKRAVEELRAARNLSILISSEPTMFPMVVGLSCRRTTYDAVRRCASALADDLESLKALRSMLAEADPGASFSKVLREEAYLSLTFCRNLEVHRERGESGGSMSSPAPLDPKAVLRSGLPSDEVSRALMTRHMELWTQAAHAMKRFPTDDEAVAAATEKIGRETEGCWSQSCMFDMALFPVFAPIVTSIRTCDADRIVTDALLGALVLRCQTGKMPRRVDDIPGVKSDPFTGKALLIKVSEASIRIYSVGQNKVDDGGIEKAQILPGQSDKTRFDIVGEYPVRRAVTRL